MTQTGNYSVNDHFSLFLIFGAVLGKEVKNEYLSPFHTLVDSNKNTTEELLINFYMNSTRKDSDFLQ